MATAGAWALLSVRPGVRTPPFSFNIYKDCRKTSAFRRGHGLPRKLGAPGVLLLNSVLTVERGRAASHQGKGWERFTDAVIRAVNEQAQPVRLHALGALTHNAKAAFCRSFASSRAHATRIRHPYRPMRVFFGCRHFSKANAFLTSKGLDPIDWRLPEDPPLAVERQLAPNC
ncbi:hypothetical protein F2981_03910 [Sinorhizobium meliloti]|nr:hypothetical protein [Sinorhizobium meliloti]